MNAPTADAQPVTLTYQRPDPALIGKRASATLSLIEDMTVTCDDEYAIAGDELKSIKKIATELEARRKEITKPMDDAKKSVMDLFRSPLELLEKAEGLLKNKMLAYSREVERKRREEQARIEAEVRAARQKSEAEAAELAKAGKAEEAQAVVESAAMMVAPAATIEAPKVAGVTMRGTWKARVTDKAAFIAFLASRPEMLALVDVNESALNAQARSLKGAMTFPGVEVFEDFGLSARKG